MAIRTQQSNGDKPDNTCRVRVVRTSRAIAASFGERRRSPTLSILRVTYLRVIPIAVVAVLVACLVGSGIAYLELAVVVLGMSAALADLHR